MKLVAVLGIAVVLPFCARADVLYNSIDAGTQSALISGSGGLYNSFLTGATTEQLTDLTLVLQVQNLELQGPNPGGTIDIGIFADNASNPGAEVYALPAYTENFTADGIYTIDLSTAATLGTTPLDLQANTRYWIGLLPDQNQTPISGWLVAADANGTGVAGEFNAGFGSVNPNSSDFQPFQMAITATPQGTSTAPEPNGLISLTAWLGILAFAAIRRRQSATQE